MWKPDVVVPEHRWRARIVWAGLLLSITAYTIWQVWKVLDGLQNPTTSLEVTNDLYEFPYVLVCFHHGQGCGYADESTDECAASAREYSSVTDWDNEERDDLIVDSMWPNCVGVDLSQLNVVDSGLTREQLGVTVNINWIVSDTASTETGYFDSVPIFNSEAEPTEDNLSYLSIPFTRYLPEDDDFDRTVAELTIGKTTKEDLSGDVTTIYPPLILSESRYTSPIDASESTDDFAYGQLLLIIRQGDFSRTTVIEQSPLDIGTFLGNIGGFWELLIVFWGLFFIATREERQPKLKARDFGKTVQAGKDIVARRRSVSVDSSVPSSGVEEPPAWESAFRGDNPNVANRAAPRGGKTRAAEAAAAVGFPVMPSAASNGHHHKQSSASSSSHGNGSSASSHRRPVADNIPRRGSRSGGGPPPGRGSAPPSYADMSAV